MADCRYIMERWKKYGRRRPYLFFIMPALVIMAVLVAFPTLFLYYISLTDYEMGYDLASANLVGINNYVRLISGRDRVFWYSVAISLLFMLVATMIEMILGYGLASLLNQKEYKLKGLVFGCLVVPIAMTPSIAGQIWKLMLNSEYGVFNYLLNRLLHIKVTWLGPDMVFLSVILIDIWQWTPYVALILYSGLRAIPIESYETAAVEGASRWQSFCYVTVPMLKPVLLIAVLFRSIDCLKTFDIPYVLTQGGPGNLTEFMSLHIYRLGFAQTGFIGRAAAMSVILSIIITVLSGFIIARMRKKEA